jgi:hypothetical protein
MKPTQKDIKACYEANYRYIGVSRADWKRHQSDEHLCAIAIDDTAAELNISFDEVAEAVFPRKERYDYDDSRL